MNDEQSNQADGAAYALANQIERMHGIREDESDGGAARATLGLARSLLAAAADQARTVAKEEAARACAELRKDWRHEHETRVVDAFREAAVKLRGVGRDKPGKEEDMPAGVPSEPEAALAEVYDHFGGAIASIKVERSYHVKGGAFVVARTNGARVPLHITREQSAILADAICEAAGLTTWKRAEEKADYLVGDIERLQKTIDARDAELVMVRGNLAAEQRYASDLRATLASRDEEVARIRRELADEKRALLDRCDLLEREAEAAEAKLEAARVALEGK